MQLLTKTNYVIGLQCLRYLWTIANDPDKLPKPDLTAKHRFAEGNIIGELAKKLYPEGIDIPTDDFKTNLNKTQELLKEGKPLFEAGFKFGDCFARADILVPNSDGWDIVEVKSGTRAKEENIHDVSFQKFCYENCDLKIRKCYLMHVNKNFIKNGEVDPKQILIKEDITPAVDEAMNGIQERINQMFAMMSLKDPPKMAIGRHCLNPFKCPVEECWNFLPENHIFCLYRGGKVSCELFEKDIYVIMDIPDEFELTDKQGIQRDCEKQRKIHIDKKGIKKFLDKLKYPLYYLDFETFNNAVPKFDGLSPYQAVPFQFSLHIVRSENAEPEHHSFLYSGKEDPRKEFISKLKEVLGNEGSIVVYNQSFEMNVLNKLAEFFPEYKEWNASLQPRFVDLIIPFRNFHYYNPKQQGSASIKKVLPAMTGKGYENLEISGGDQASVEFYNVTYKNTASQEEIQKVRVNLEKYCGLDTEGMIWIVDKLRELII